jgi:hypothetical protein
MRWASDVDRDVLRIGIRRPGDAKRPVRHGKNLMRCAAVTI